LRESGRIPTFIKQKKKVSSPLSKLLENDTTGAHGQKANEQNVQCITASAFKAGYFLVDTVEGERKVQRAKGGNAHCRQCPALITRSAKAVRTIKEQKTVQSARTRETC